ncbi:MULTISPECIES: ATP-binding protein [unclassified Moraxella]|uniref:ATP-binding protein n=1 Tax=unclassified Moraxella TaxID=2685852 RepID=UPI003AF7B261
MPTLTNNIPDNIGQFYLGTDVYPQDTQGQPTLYDMADLTTHAVIIGMTGSGKTGLGISLLEEASLDNVPIIAIDPKGDLGNLALTFPNLAPSDFEPWVDKSLAGQSGLSEADFAKQTAEQLAKDWQQGLANTHQTLERVQALKNANPVSIYTPGSDNGLSIALLGNLVPPPDAVKAEGEAYAEYIDATVSALLMLLKVNGDNFSPEHVFLAQLLKTAWDNNQTLTLVDLITQIQTPPFDKVGIMPLAQVFADKDRMALAMKLNTLLASPSFANWLKGMPLDCGSLFYGTDGKAQTSVMNIAHLSDDERLFFVTLLLTNLLAWMRRQQGTSTLRAILYMDEVFGYLPPNGNPPTKVLLLTLLKQARAFGLGIVLATQNPVDLDYKALSNAGTWFIGRLQTAQDRERVMDGLLSAGSNNLTKAELGTWFDQLGKRQFLLKNIHEASPVIFATRFTLNYLSGPLSKNAIATLKAQKLSLVNAQNPAQIGTAIPAVTADPLQSSSNQPPALPKDIGLYFLPKDSVSEGQTFYQPQAFAYARVFFNDKKSGANTQQQLILTTPFGEPPLVVDWHGAVLSDVSFEQLQTSAHQPAVFKELPTQALDKANWKAWEKEAKEAIRQQQVLNLWWVESVGLYSEVGETEASFRNRLAVPLREQRDIAIAKLRDSVAKKQEALNKKIQTANEKYEKESAEANKGWLDAGMSIGSAVLGAFMGRKALSQTNITHVKRAMNSVGDMNATKQSVAELDGVRQQLQAEYTALEQDLQSQLDALAQQFDPQSIAFDSVQITPNVKDISILLVGVLYQPI